MTEALRLEGVRKAYAEVEAVRGLDLSVSSGSVYGLLGPNGAGKTTTIRMIMDIIKPDRGQIRLLGESDPEKRRDRIGYLPEERGLYRKMKVRDLLLYFARLRRVPAGEARRRADAWIERFELGDWTEAKIEALSKGMQQKVQFIGTLLHQPELVILDEPFSGLDPVNVDLVKGILLELRDQGTTFLLSTHQMEAVEKLCDAICLIHHGSKILDGRLDEIKGRTGIRSIQLEYEGRTDLFRRQDLVSRCDDSGHYVELTPAEGVAPEEILRAAAAEVKIRRFQVMEPSLHQIFVETVRGRGEEA